jgi:hypothetical protein
MPHCFTSLSSKGDSQGFLELVLMPTQNRLEFSVIALRKVFLILYLFFIYLFFILFYHSQPIYRSVTPLAAWPS